MNRKEQAEAAFLEVFRQHAQSDQPGVYAFDVIREAQDVAMPLTRGQKASRALLGLLGRNYSPGYSVRLYPTLARLERKGLVVSDWEYPPVEGERHPRRLYQLAKIEPVEAPPELRERVMAAAREADAQTLRDERTRDLVDAEGKE